MSRFSTFELLSEQEHNNQIDTFKNSEDRFVFNEKEIIPLIKYILDI